MSPQKLSKSALWRGWDKGDEKNLQGTPRKKCKKGRYLSFLVL